MKLDIFKFKRSLAEEHILQAVPWLGQSELVQFLIIVRKLHKSKILVNATIRIIGFLDQVRDVYFGAVHIVALLLGVLLV